MSRDFAQKEIICVSFDWFYTNINGNNNETSCVLVSFANRPKGDKHLYCIDSYNKGSLLTGIYFCAVIWYVHMMSQTSSKVRVPSQYNTNFYHNNLNITLIYF